MATALFVIDIQNDLATDPKTRIPHAERIKVAGEAILAAARMQQGAPQIIIFVQHEEQPEDGVLVRGSDPWKLVFEPREDAPRERRIPKWTRDTFESNPTLASELKAQGVEGIIAFGIQSECCVESTCTGALAAGFKVTLLSGAHSTYDNGDRSAEHIEREVEDRLRHKGSSVVLWQEVVAVWEGKDGNSVASC